MGIKQKDYNNAPLLTVGQMNIDEMENSKIISREDNHENHMQKHFLLNEKITSEVYFTRISNNVEKQEETHSEQYLIIGCVYKKQKIQVSLNIQKAIDCNSSNGHSSFDFKALPVLFQEIIISYLKIDATAQLFFTTIIKIHFSQNQSKRISGCLKTFLGSSLSLQFLKQHAQSMLFIGNFDEFSTSDSVFKFLSDPRILHLPYPLSDLITSSKKQDDFQLQVQSILEDLQPGLDLELLNNDEITIRTNSGSRIKKTKPNISTIINQRSLNNKKNMESSIDLSCELPLKKISLGVGIIADTIQQAEKYKIQETSSSKVDDEEIVDNDENPYSIQIQKKIVKQLLIRTQITMPLRGLSQESKKLYLQSQQFAEVLSKYKPCLNQQFGSLVPLMSARSIENMLVELIQKLYSQPIIKINLPKILIVANQNKRGEQIIAVLEELLQKFKGLFSLYKGSKKTKNAQNNEDYWKTEIDQNNVFLFLSKKLLQHLQFGDFKITSFDYLILDEANSTYSEHPYNQIMQEVFFNHEKNFQNATFACLPYVVPTFSFENCILHSAQDRTSILFQLKTLSNTYNAPLLMLSLQQALIVKKQLSSQALLAERSNFTTPMHRLSNNNNIRLIKGMIEYITKTEKACCVRPSPWHELHRVKWIDEHLHVATEKANLTLPEAKKVFEVFGNKCMEILAQGIGSFSQIEEAKRLSQGPSQAMAIYKPQIYTAQFVPNKIRYFSSRLTIDDTLWPFFKWIIAKIDPFYKEFIDENTSNTIEGYQLYSRKIIDNISDLSTSQYFQAIKNDNQKTHLNKFKKKLEAESFVMLEAIYLLHQEKLLDDHFRPNEDIMRRTLTRKKNDPKITQNEESKGGDGPNKKDNDDKNGNKIIKDPQNKDCGNNNTHQDAHPHASNGSNCKQEEEESKQEQYSKNQATLELQETLRTINQEIKKNQKVKISEQITQEDNLQNQKHETFYKLSLMTQRTQSRLLSGSVPFFLKKKSKSSELQFDQVQANNCDIKPYLETLDNFDQQRFTYLTENISYHRAYEDNAIRKLSVFISQILNPILEACDQYEMNANKEEQSLKWWNKDLNIIVDSQQRFLKFKELTYKEQKEYEIRIKVKKDELAENKKKEKEEVKVRMLEANQQNQVENDGEESDGSTLSTDLSGRKANYKLKNIYYNKFKAFTKVMFNNEKLKHLKDKNTYMLLVNMIDQSAEKFKMPGYLVRHLRSKYWDIKRYQDSIVPTFNRKCLLQLLLIALCDREPINLEFEFIKIEMNRLSFVGDQVINLACIMNMVLTTNIELLEKDLDSNKNKIIKQENLKKAAESFGLNFFKIKTKQFKSPPSGQQIKIQQEQQDRELADIVQALAGYFAIYIGFNAAFLFLVELGVLKIEQQLEIGNTQTSINSKIQILEDLSEKRKSFINESKGHNQQKDHIYNLIKKSAANNIMSPDSFKLPFSGDSSFNINLSFVKEQIAQTSKTLEKTNISIIQEKT